jgi:hypothetical protein
VFIVPYKSVLCESDLVLNRSIAYLDGLGVTLTDSELFSTIGSTVGVDNTLHTYSTYECVINSTELLKIEMRIELIFHSVREEEIFINCVRHN